MGKHRSDSSDEDRREHKKHKKQDKKEKKEKKDKKEKKLKDKDKDKEAALLKEAKRFLKQRLEGGGGAAAAGPSGGGSARGTAAATALLSDRPTVPPGSFQPITADDYFSRNADFAAWLRDAKNAFFSDLSTEEARAAFEGEFVPAYNSGRLPAKFYAGSAAGAARRTGYTWGFAGAGGTERAAPGELGVAAAVAEREALEAAAREADRAAGRAATKRQREAGQAWLDEYLPKPGTAREAKADARAARRTEARERDASPDAGRLAGGGDVMGGDDSFAAARAREARRQEGRARQLAVRREEAAAKLAAHQAAEDKKLEQFRALLAQGPVQIAKRTQ